MKVARFGAVALSFAGLGGCGPTPPTVPPQPAQVEIAAPVATTAAPAQTGPDLSPVAEPADIVGLARWRNPIGTASNLASCAGVAPVLVEVNARMAVADMLNEFIRGDQGRKLAALVAIDAPLDVIVVLDSDERPRPPHFAFAVGLTSLDSAKAATEGNAPSTEVAPGVWRVKSRRGTACGVAASAGATPARLVCSNKEKALTTLAPYIARTMPSLDLGSPDMHIEMRLATLEKRYGAALRKTLRVLPDSFSTEMGIGDARFDRLLWESGQAAQEDASKLLSDVRLITADLTSATSGTCLRATADIDFSSTESWVAETLTDRLDRNGPPPAIYFRQPKDSDVAMYGRGVDPARFTDVIKKTREMLDAALKMESFSTADRKKITDLIDLPLGKDATTVMSHGSLDVPMPQLGSGRDRMKTFFQAAFERTIGWTLLGFEQKPETIKKLLKDQLGIYKSGTVQARLKKAVGTSDAKHLPTIRNVTAPATLGKGAEITEITFPNVDLPPPPDAQGPGQRQVTSLKLYMVLMPDGDSTWLAFGAAKDELVKHLLVTKTGANDKDQLASRADLEPLRQGKQMFGGFISAAPIAEKTTTVMSSIETIEPGSFPGYALSLIQGLNSLPNGGHTPLFIMGSGESTGTSTKLRLSLAAQQGTFEDSKALAISAYTFFHRVGILP